MCYIIVTNCRYRYIIHNYSEKEVFHKACLLWLNPNTNETTGIYKLASVRWNKRIAALYMIAFLIIAHLWGLYYTLFADTGYFISGSPYVRGEKNER